MRPQHCLHQSGGKRKRIVGRLDLNFQEGDPTLPHSWLRLILSALRRNHLNTLVPLLKRLVHHVFSQPWNQVAQFSYLCHAHTITITSVYPHIQPGGTSPVCEREDDKFICPTTDASSNLACDEARCPLQGPPVAPKIGPEPTGQFCFDISVAMNLKA